MPANNYILTSNGNFISEDELYHHGILGMKWGVRKYQNPDGSLTNKGKKRYLKDMQKDQDAHFRSQISKEASKVTNIGRNGYDQRGSSWTDAYRKKKVTSEDDVQIRKAAAETRKYMKAKYGESAVKALARSGDIFNRKISDFVVKYESFHNPEETEEVIKRMQKRSLGGGNNI